MIKKVYVADAVRAGQACGYCWAVIWFWQSPLVAADRMTRFAQSRDYNITQIRRLR